MTYTLSCFQRTINNKYYIGDDSKVVHLYPSRTQKLSTLTPTIAEYAKIGNRQYFFYFFIRKNIDFYSIYAIISLCFLYDSLAQLVEQLTLNQWV